MYQTCKGSTVTTLSGLGLHCQSCSLILKLNGQHDQLQNMCQTSWLWSLICLCTDRRCRGWAAGLAADIAPTVGRPISIEIKTPSGQCPDQSRMTLGSSSNTRKLNTRLLITSNFDPTEVRHHVHRWWSLVAQGIPTCSRASVHSDALQDAITASWPQILSVLLVTRHSLRHATCLLCRRMAMRDIHGLQSMRNSCSDFGCRLG